MSADPRPAPPWPSPSRAWFTVALCMLAYVLAFVDRQILALLVDPIRADLRISDTQFSLVHGLAFSVFYALFGLPIARLADGGPRPAIIAAGIFIWSIATAVCGLARSFTQLFVARMVVGIGEAALSPTAYSIISDSFPRSRLGLALGVYSLGAFIGSGLAFIVGGAVVDLVARFGVPDLPFVGVLRPWQVAFFVVGLPGVVMALLFAVLVRDPPRRGAGDGRYTLGEVRAHLVTHRGAVIAHFGGFAALALNQQALFAWAPAYLTRVHGMAVSDTGLVLGAVVLTACTAGALTSGWLADRLSRRGHDDAAFRAGITGGLGVLLPAALFPFVADRTACIAVMALAFYFASFPIAASAIGLQVMAPNRMRAQVSALFFLLVNLVGITGGASLVALLTDGVFRDDAAVGYSIAVICTLAGAIGAAVLAGGLAAFRRTARAAAQSAAG